MKQTVEEAAQAAFPYIWPKNGQGEDIVQRVGQRAPGIRKCEDKQKAFIDGSAWQKQQGIDWIRCDMELPAPFERTNFGANSLQVLISDGLNLSNTHYAYSHAGEGIGWFALVFTPTHWAIINLPKTDE